MNNRKNYYQLLHVQQDAPTEVIRSSYRALMQKLKMHPDLGGDQQEAALVNEAYAVLTNPAAREKYDATLVIMNSADRAATERSVKQKTDAEPVDLVTGGVCVFCKTPHSLGNSLPPDSSCSNCDSSLFPATKHALVQSDQRIIERINRQWHVTFYTQWPANRSYTGKTHDVSLNGMQLLTSTELANQQIIKISSSTLDAVARVVNRRQEQYGLISKRWRIGLEFLTLRFHQTQGAFLKIDV